MAATGHEAASNLQGTVHGQIKLGFGGHGLIGRSCVHHSHFPPKPWAKFSIAKVGSTVGNTVCSCQLGVGSAEDPTGPPQLQPWLVMRELCHHRLGRGPGRVCHLTTSPVLRAWCQSDVLGRLLCLVGAWRKCHRIGAVQERTLVMQDEDSLCQLNTACSALKVGNLAGGRSSRARLPWANSAGCSPFSDH